MEEDSRVGLISPPFNWYKDSDPLPPVDIPAHAKLADEGSHLVSWGVKVTDF